MEDPYEAARSHVRTIGVEQARLRFGARKRCFQGRYMRAQGLASNNSRRHTPSTPFAYFVFLRPPSSLAWRRFATPRL